MENRVFKILKVNSLKLLIFEEDESPLSALAADELRCQHPDRIFRTQPKNKKSPPKRGFL